MSKAHTPEEKREWDNLMDMYRGIEQLKLKRFTENLAYVTLWKQYEMLELVKQHVDIWHVSIIWLQKFRDDLDLKV